MELNSFWSRTRLAVVLATALAGFASAGSSLLCDFNDLAEGQIDGQKGWDVYDKVKDSSAFSVVTEVGTTEAAGDHALVIRRSQVPIRCVCDDPVRWIRKQTLRVEFDFRVVVPVSEVATDEPVMTVFVGNTVLSETARWEVRLLATTNGTWTLSAALPDESVQEIPAEAFRFMDGEATKLSDWLHCVIEIEKLSEMDSFKSSVRIVDRAGQPLAGVACTDGSKDEVTKAIWNLSRVSAGFFAAEHSLGLVCVDNFRISTEP